jgi:hypothetical protein
MGEGHGEPLLDVGLDLRPQPQHEATLREGLEIVADVGQIHGVAGEGHRDPGGQLQTLGVLGGQGQGQEGIVLGLGGDEPVVAHGLHPPGPLPHRAQGRRHHDPVHLHRLTPPRVLFST